MFAELFNNLYCIHNISKKELFNENWGNITFFGTYSNQNKSYFKDINDELAKLSIQNSIHFFIENTEKKCQYFIEELQGGDNWKLNINKNILLKKTEAYNFFYSEHKLIDWIKQTNPFSCDYPFNDKKINIIVNGLKDNFGGNKFVVCNSDYQYMDDTNVVWNNYDETLIMDNIHTISNSIFIIKPLNHFLTFGKVTDVSKYFYRNSILVLLASLCNEIYENGDIILRGYRRMPMKLGFGYVGNEISVEYQTQLSDAVKWVYQSTERCDLRLKLLLERVTLDIDYSLPYFQGLFNIIKEATNQAKERYSFIIYDRKDLYLKDLKELLKDLKTLSELYSNKLRSLLSNLLRDVLAAFILVGITLFSKTTEIVKLFENKLIEYVFIAFGSYFVISAIFQIITDSFDLFRSNKEFDYWKNITKEYMPQKDFNKHKSKVLTKRVNGTIIIYAIVALCYFAIAFVCFNFPCIWNKIIN
jgi:hypothetical protein